MDSPHDPVINPGMDDLLSLIAPLDDLIPYPLPELLLPIPGVPEGVQEIPMGLQDLDLFPVPHLMAS